MTEERDKKERAARYHLLCSMRAYIATVREGELCDTDDADLYPLILSLDRIAQRMHDANECGLLRNRRMLDDIIGTVIMRGER